MFRKPEARFRNGGAARSGNQPREPLGSFPVDVLVDEIDLLRSEPLQGNPDLGIRVEGAHAFRHIFQKREDKLRWIAARIAAGKEDAG